MALGGGLLNSCMWLRMSFEIKIHDDATIPFHSLVRTTTVSPAEVNSARAKQHALGLGDVLQAEELFTFYIRCTAFMIFSRQVSL